MNHYFLEKNIYNDNIHQFSEDVCLCFLIYNDSPFYCSAKPF